MNQTFLVTGASGFIGTWVVRELLHRDFNVLAFDTVPGGVRWKKLLGENAKKVSFVRGDLTQIEKLGAVIDEHRVGHIIHLAGLLTPQCHASPVLGAEVNVMGFLRLMELVRGRPERVKGLSYASSIAVYGPEWEDGDKSASGLHEPRTFYGAFKLADEILAQQYWHHFKIPSVGLRPFVVFGPGREIGLTASPTLAARAVAEGQPYHFLFSGQTGFEYVEDTARAFVECALLPGNLSLSIDLPGISANVEEVLDILEELRPGARGRLGISGPPLPYPVSPNQRTISDLFPDWKQTDLRTGLERTLQYYEEDLQKTESAWMPKELRS